MSATKALGHATKALGQRVRAEAIRAQLSAGITVVTAVKRSVRFGNRPQVQEIVNRISNLLSTLGRHIDEPHHVEADAVPALRAELGYLEKLLLEINAGH